MGVRNFLARLRLGVMALRWAAASVLRLVLELNSANDAGPGLMSEKKQKRKTSYQRSPGSVNRGNSCLCFLPRQFLFLRYALPVQAVCLAVISVNLRCFTSGMRGTAQCYAAV